MSRNRKLFKGTVVALIALSVGWLALDNIVFDPRKGFMTRGGLALSWVSPTQNADNSPLTDLAGYSIYCWNAESHKTETIRIDDPELTTYELDHVWPGTYQCAMSAIKVDGSQSALSNVITRTVP